MKAQETLLPTLAAAVAVLFLAVATSAPAQDRPVVIEPGELSGSLQAAPGSRPPFLLDSMRWSFAAESQRRELRLPIETLRKSKYNSRRLRRFVAPQQPQQQTKWVPFHYRFDLTDAEKEARVSPDSDSYAFQVAQQFRTKGAMGHGELIEVDLCFHKPGPDSFSSNHTIWTYLHPDEKDAPGPAFAESPLTWSTTWDGVKDGDRRCFEWPLPNVAFAPDQVFWISVAWRGDRGRQQEGLAGKTIVLEANSVNPKSTRVVGRTIQTTSGDLTFGGWTRLSGVHSVSITAHTRKAVGVWPIPDVENVVEYRYDVSGDYPYDRWAVRPPERPDQAVEVAQRFRLRDSGVVRWVAAELAAAPGIGFHDQLYSRVWFDLHADAGGRPGPSLLSGPAPRVAIVDDSYESLSAWSHPYSWNTSPHYGSLSVPVAAGDVWVSVRWLHPNANVFDGVYYYKYSYRGSVRPLPAQALSLRASYYVSDHTEVVGRFVDLDFPGGIEDPGKGDPRVVRQDEWKPVTALPLELWCGDACESGDAGGRPNGVAIVIGVDHTDKTPPPDPPPPPPPGSSCAPETPVLQFEGGYSVGMCWEAADGRQGSASGGPWSSHQAGLLWFFEPENPEVLVKVLDGCVVNGHRWVFVAPVTDLAFNLQVTGPGGASWHHTNQLGATAEARGDTAAFPCTASEIAGAGGGVDGPGATGATRYALPGADVPEYAASAVAARDRSSSFCSPAARLLDLDGYTVSMCWRAPDGREGDAKAGIWESSYAGMLWFFDKANPEVLIKVLDGCGVNGYRWVFVAPVTTLEFNILVTAPDGTVWRHTNAQGATASTASDSAAFKCA